MIKFILSIVTIYLINAISKSYFGDTFFVGYYTFIFTMILYFIFNVKVVLSRKEE